MKIEHNDRHTIDFLDEAGMSYMALVVHELNTVLVANGVNDSGKRQEICVSFLFTFAYNLDAGWFIEGSNKFFPKLCFACRASPKDSENLGQIESLHISTEASSWHEYAHGVVSQYFEDESEAPPTIRTGSYEIEN